MAKRGRTLAAIVLLIAVVLTIAALFLPWYSEEFSAAGFSETQNAYLGFPTTNGTIQYTCSSNVPNCHPSSSYSAQNATHVGSLAEAGYLLIIVDAVLGLVAVGLAFASRNNPRRAGAAIALGVVAMLIVIAAAGYFAVALPGAIASDTPNHSGSGPWSSFIGSNTTSGLSLTWGPTIGWYLAIGAFVLFLVGAIILARSRKDPPAPAPAVVPTPAAAPQAQ